jgi:hypothetical protein
MKVRLTPTADTSSCLSQLAPGRPAEGIADLGQSFHLRLTVFMGVNLQSGRHTRVPQDELGISSGPGRWMPGRTGWCRPMR